MPLFVGFPAYDGQVLTCHIKGLTNRGSLYSKSVYHTGLERRKIPKTNLHRDKNIGPGTRIIQPYVIIQRKLSFIYHMAQTVVLFYKLATVGKKFVCIIYTGNITLIKYTLKNNVYEISKFKYIYLQIMCIEYEYPKLRYI